MKSASVAIRRTQKKSWLSASGVALADILANSVAVVLILIILTLSIKQEQTELQLDQTVDLDILMARQLAQSVVMNDLPSSQPALLHNYHSCDIPHDCNPALYPVIELHRDGIRIYNNGRFYKRPQLMQDNSGFDEYMASLNPDHIRNIRVDIYHIRQFYLAVSILREYQAPLRHWHFLGEQASPPVAGEGAPDGTANEEPIAKRLQDGETGWNIDGDSSEESDALSGLSQLPEGSSLLPSERIQGLEQEDLLPPEELLTDSSNGGRPGMPADGNSSTNDALLDKLFDGLLDGDAPQGNAIGRQGKQVFRLRLPNMRAEENSGETIELPYKHSDMQLLILSFLYQSLEQIQASQGIEADILNQLFQQLVEGGPALWQQHPLFPLVRQIQDKIKGLTNSTAAALQPFFQAGPEQPPALLSLPINTPLSEITWHAKWLPEYQRTWLQETPQQLDLLLRLYPYVHRGDRIALASQYLALLHPQQREQGTLLRWLPLALVSPNLKEMTLGYVYGQTQDDRLLLPLDVNQIRINNIPLHSLPNTVENRFPIQLLQIYLPISLLLIAFFFWLIKSRRLSYA